MWHQLDRDRLGRLLEAGRGLLADLDLSLVLDRLLDTARDITDARFAALGILDERRRELEQFLTVGIEESAHGVIGDLPRGRGILGVLIDEPRPLRLHDVNADPRSYGFPPGHPPMHSFLGVPIIIRGEAWGNLYLTEKAGGGDFDDADEAAVMLLAEWAAIAIENARLYGAVDARRDELERAVRALEATATIARAVGGETDLGRVLELIVKRGRALVDARSVLILLRDGDMLRVAAGAGRLEGGGESAVSLGEWLLGAAQLDGLRPRRIDDVDRELGVPSERLGVPDASTALLVPLSFRSRVLGVLAAFDRLTGDPAFTDDDAELLEAFAASAATAVATAQTVESDRLRHSLRAAEEERKRWARELHDETLQGLAGLKVLLAGAARRGEPARMAEALSLAADQVGQEIANLRSIIAELRPAALDELGLEPALNGLLERTAFSQGLDMQGELHLPEGRLSPELETVIYRLVQETLTNVAKHAQASSVDLRLEADDGHLTLTVRDDGIGFDPAAPRSGYGLAGMRERVALAGGRLDIAPGDTGTVVRASLPIAYDEAGSSTRPRPRA